MFLLAVLVSVAVVCIGAGVSLTRPVRVQPRSREDFYLSQLRRAYVDGRMDIDEFEVDVQRVLGGRQPAHHAVQPPKGKPCPFVGVAQFGISAAEANRNLVQIGKALREDKTGGFLPPGVRVERITGPAGDVDELVFTSGRTDAVSR
jgi:hypothetical protein